MPNKKDTIILDLWEQALEDATSLSLGTDPYNVTSLAKDALHNNTVFIHIPVSQLSLSQIHKRAEKQNKTTTSYLRELVEHA